MTELVGRRPNGTFLPGYGGRTPGARSKLATEVPDTFLADFKQHGAAALVKVREQRPADYWRIACQLLPQQVLVNAMVAVEDRSPFDGLDPAAKRAIAMKLYEQIEAEAEVVNVGTNVDTDATESKS